MALFRAAHLPSCPVSCDEVEQQLLNAVVQCRARDKETGHMCALKKIKMEKEKDGFPQTSIREINILLSFHHPNIVGVCFLLRRNTLNKNQATKCLCPTSKLHSPACCHHGGHVKPCMPFIMVDM